MKNFKGNRPLTDIDKKMSDLGMLIDKSDFNKGGDWVTYKGSFYNIPASITFNVATGCFSVINGFTGEQKTGHQYYGTEMEAYEGSDNCSTCNGLMCDACKSYYVVEDDSKHIYIGRNKNKAVKLAGYDFT